MDPTIYGGAAFDYEGTCTAMNSSGSIVATCAPSNDTNGNNSGRIRVFEWSGILWEQEGSDIYGENIADQIGNTEGINNLLSLNNEGYILAIGSHANDDIRTNSGIISIYEWSDTLSDWVKKGTSLSGVLANGKFANSKLNGDGLTIITGSRNHDNSDLTNNGLIQVYEWSDVQNDWVKKGSALVGNTVNDAFGRSVSINDKGDVIAAASHNIDSDLGNEGEINIYQWSDELYNWEAKGESIKGEVINGKLYRNICLDSSGNTIAVSSVASDLGGSNSGLVRIFDWNGTSWVQRGNDIYGEIESNTGYGLSLSSDGNVVGIGTAFTQTSDVISYARVFRWDNTSWEQIGDNILGEELRETFGTDLTINSKGDRIIIGGRRNDVIGTNAGLSKIFQAKFQIDENNNIGDVVGILRGLNNENFNFSLTNSSSYPDNNNFEIVGNEIKAIERLNYEEQQSHTINVRGSYNGTNITNQFTFTIIDKNDTPSKINITNSNLEENVASDTVIGELSVVDEDPSDVHTFSILQVEDFNGDIKTPTTEWFDLVGNVLVSKRIYENEDSDYYDITINVNDGTIDYQEKLRIYIDNIYDDFNSLPLDYKPCVTYLVTLYQEKLYKVNFLVQKNKFFKFSLYITVKDIHPYNRSEHLI